MDCCRFVLGPLLAAATLVAPEQSGHADEAAHSESTARSGDEAAVRSAAAAYREAIDKGDLDAVTSFWAGDADYVDQAGRAYKIKEGLERAKQLSHGAARATACPLKTKILSIRFVTPDVAIEDGVFERTQAAADQSAQGQYAAVWVKRDGKWLIDSLRRVAAARRCRHRPPEEFGLDDRRLGRRRRRRHGRSLVPWGPDKAYMLREIKLQPKGDKPVSVTQWIGWDPTHKRIRSFAFDSFGGYSDGVWTNEGDAWVANTTGVLPDGRRTSATNLYSRIDDDTAIWESIDDEEDGRPGADVRLRAMRKQAAK